MLILDKNKMWTTVLELHLLILATSMTRCMDINITVFITTMVTVATPSLTAFPSAWGRSEGLKWWHYGAALWGGGRGSELGRGRGMG